MCPTGGTGQVMENPESYEVNNIPSMACLLFCAVLLLLTGAEK